MSSYRHLPISRQIILVASGLLLALFAVVTLVVTRLNMQHALENTEKTLSQQAATIRGMLDAYFENVQARGNRQSELLRRYLQGETERGTGLVRSGSVDLPELRAGGHVLNNNHALLEGFRDLSKSDAAFLVLVDGKVYRAATLLKKDGQFMDGSQVAETDPVAVALLKGEDYAGLTVRNGQYFFSVVKALKDREGKVFGGASVRVSLDSELKQIRNTLSAIVSGTTGYVYIVRPTGDDKTLADFVLHPTLQGKTVADANSASLYTAIASILAKREGVLHYLFANKDGVEQEKIVVLATSPGWNWVVGVGSWTDEYMEDSYRLRNILILVGVLAAGLSGFMIYLVVNARLQPLQGVVSVIERMGAGDFRQARLERDEHSQNEVLHLGSELDKTAGRIRDLLKNARQTSEQVGASANAVEGAVREMLSSAESEAQAAASMAATMEEIASSITLVADNARGVVDVTRASRNAAQDGGKLMADTVAEMEQIAADIQQSADLVRALGERSQQISGIVSVIRDIADQTNLLALNAAIEAARAGEAGRGFAVVADEVRKLAERTAVSTQEISQTIQAIVGDTQNAVDHMEGVREQMTNGVVLARQANQALLVINDQAERSLRDVNEIADAAQEQSSAVQQVATNVERVAVLSEENHATASQNLTQAIELRSVAGEMQKSLSRFEL